MAYKNDPSGVYYIRCNANNKSYFGCAKKCKKRLHSNKSDLRNGRHTNSLLQKDFSKFGEEFFDFGVKEETSASKTRKHYYINKYKTYNEKYGYNTLESGYNLSGVYLIRCTSNQKLYVGSSRNIGKRFNYHKSELRSQSHYNENMQDDWNRFGENAFMLEILELTADLLPREKEWINKLEADRVGYNQCSENQHTSSKIYIVTNPSGQSTKIVNLRKFCRENGLCYSSMSRVSSGSMNSYKSWKVKKA